MTIAQEKNYQVTVSNKQILGLALPIAFAILVPQINFVTNNIFLGNLDQSSLALAGITGVFYLIFAVVGNGVNNGLQAIIARRAGENRIDEIGKLFSQGLRIVVLLSVAGIVITYFLAPWIFSHTLSDPGSTSKVVEFLRIRMWGLIFLYIYQLGNAVLIGTNQSKFLIYGTFAETVANIILDYGLIKGRLGLPKMGFNGAAVASVIAEATGMLVVYIVIHFKGVSRQLKLSKHFEFDAKNIRLIFVQSSPLVMQYAISIISWEFFYILIEHHGQRDLAISNAMRNIFGCFGALTWAFASTTNMMVSNIIGQGKSDEVIKLINKIVKLSVTCCFIIALVLNIFPHTALSVYGQDEDFIEHAIPILRVVSLALILMSIGTIWLNAVTGTGNTKVNLAIEFITIVFYCIYVYLVLGYWNLPILYGWMSEWLYWIFLFTMAFFYIKSGRWKNKNF
ncbi:MAG: MATE family efflux transporter [Bacteroidetes bacterium]|nr:MATE family efflux transporter [Bacteroidota bacterium]